MTERMYVMTVKEGIHPEVLGPFNDVETVRLVALRKHAAQDPWTDTVFVLMDDGKGGLAVET
jgi:hypothetical protein